MGQLKKEIHYCKITHNWPKLNFFYLRICSDRTELSARSPWTPWRLDSKYLFSTISITMEAFTMEDLDELLCLISLDKVKQTLIHINVLYKCSYVWNEP